MTREYHETANHETEIRFWTNEFNPLPLYYHCTDTVNIYHLCNDRILESCFLDPLFLYLGIRGTSDSQTNIFTLNLS